MNSVVTEPAPYTIETLGRLREMAARGLTVAAAAIALGWSPARIRKIAFHHGILFDLPMADEMARAPAPIRRTPSGHNKLVVRSIGLDPMVLTALERSADREGVTLQVRVRDLLAEAVAREAMAREMAAQEMVRR